MAWRRPFALKAFYLLGRGTFFDATNGLVTTWLNPGQFGGPSRIFAARLSLAMPEAGFGTSQLITEASGFYHHATLLSTGEVLIVYEEVATSNIVMKRGTLKTLTPTSPVITVTNTAAPERSPFAVAAGGEVLIFWHEDAGKTWQFKWYDIANGSFSAALPLAGIVTTVEFGERHSAVDSTNTVWVAFTTPSDPHLGGQIQAIEVPPGKPPGPAPNTGISPQPQ